MITATILALDASSTTIGYCVYWNEAVLDHGEIKLTGTDIAERCRQAHAALNLILSTAPDVDAIAIEAPASPHKKSLIPQCRVSGALMAAAALKGLMVVEVTPQAGKIALTGKGNADKAAMQARARAYGVTGEHEADALGVALVAVGMVEVEHAAV
jgi:Holliday junction resolvasome RuvABC endonuclease subunit